MKSVRIGSLFSHFRTEYGDLLYKFPEVSLNAGSCVAFSDLVLSTSLTLVCFDEVATEFPSDGIP